MMKKLVFSLFLVSSILMGHAEKRAVAITVSQKTPDKRQVQRSPMRLPIDIIYDTEARIVEITCYSDLEAEVYLYDASGALEDYSPCLNAVLSVSDSQYHTILIEGDGWEATGVIE